MTLMRFGAAQSKNRRACSVGTYLHSAAANPGVAQLLTCVRYAHA